MKIQQGVTLATFKIMATFGNTFIGFLYRCFLWSRLYCFMDIYDIFDLFLLLVSVGMIIIIWGREEKLYFEYFKINIFIPTNDYIFITIFAKTLKFQNL